MSMPNVYDEIYKYAKNYISTSEYNPHILKASPERSVFPVVIIKQTNDSIYKEDLNKGDQMYNISFDIEIYTMNIKKVSKQEVANEIMIMVNEVFDNHYGMNRVMNKEGFNADTDVFRWIMKYEAKIDERKRIFRR